MPLFAQSLERATLHVNPPCTQAVRFTGTVTSGHGGYALLNAAGSVVAGLVCVWLGRALGDFLLAG